MKFYQCDHCGNRAVKLLDSGVPLVCCGQPMRELEAGVTDASAEKHVPVVYRSETAAHVQVGRDAHPMKPEHRIDWIVLETDGGVHVRFLSPGDSPYAVFPLDEGEIISDVYASCNLHGLWKAGF